MQSNMAQKWSRTEAITGAILFLFCLLVALTQFVNPFPHDGWFASQYRLLQRSPGADNYTPVSVPALLYALLHFIAARFDRGLGAEFYLGSLAHHLMLFASGVFLYLSHRLLNLRNAGLVVSVCLVVFIESTLMPQAFWSENVTLCLMSAVLFVGFVIVTTPALGNKSFFTLTTIFGLLLGGLTITRLIPCIILPGIILLYFFHLPRARVIRFALLATGVVLVVVLTTMTANAYRYGRFELTNSAGRHLWNVVSVRSDEMLAGSREYQLLKRGISDTQGKFWWDIDPGKIEGLKHLAREELFQILSMQAITSHPITFAAIGMQNTLWLLESCPGRIGLSRALHYNPLRRDTMLPPLVDSPPVLEHFLELFHRMATQVYPYAVYGALMLGLLVTSAGAIFSTRSAKTEITLPGAWLFLVGSFFSMLYLTGQIERPDGRYGILHLPLLLIISSSAIGMLTRIWAKTSWKALRGWRLLEKEKTARSV